MKRRVAMIAAVLAAGATAGCATNPNSPPTDYSNLPGSGDQMNGPGLLSGDHYDGESGTLLYSDDQPDHAVFGSVRDRRASGSQPATTSPAPSTTARAPAETSAPAAAPASTSRAPTGQTATGQAPAPNNVSAADVQSFEDFRAYKRFKQLPADSAEKQRFQDWQEWQQYKQWQQGHQ